MSIAFGLTVVTMAYAIGHISGCHLNPAVSIGLWSAGRLPGEKLLGYILFQLLGGIVAGGVLFLIASGRPRLQYRQRFCLKRLWRTLAARLLPPRSAPYGNSDDDDVHDRHSWRDRQQSASGARTGCHRFCLTLIHLISIPVTNTSVNPARSTGVAVYMGGWAMTQLWLFWVAPIAGALIGSSIYKSIGGQKS